VNMYNLGLFHDMRRDIRIHSQFHFITQVHTVRQEHFMKVTGEVEIEYGRQTRLMTTTHLEPYYTRIIE
jgi:hypothetical protein